MLSQRCSVLAARNESEPLIKSAVRLKAPEDNAGSSADRLLSIRWSGFSGSLTSLCGWYISWYLFLLFHTRWMFSDLNPLNIVIIRCFSIAWSAAASAVCFLFSRIHFLFSRIHFLLSLHVQRSAQSPIDSRCASQVIGWLIALIGYATRLPAGKQVRLDFIFEFEMFETRWSAKSEDGEMLKRLFPGRQSEGEDVRELQYER